MDRDDMERYLKIGIAVLIIAAIAAVIAGYYGLFDMPVPPRPR